VTNAARDAAEVRDRWKAEGVRGAKRSARDVAQVVRASRESARTNKDFARWLGVSDSTLAYWRKGCDSRGRDWPELREFLGMPMSASAMPAAIPGVSSPIEEAARVLFDAGYCVFSIVVTTPAGNLLRLDAKEGSAS
jgi:transposase-like protein